jgi:hypothetical protein
MELLELFTGTLPPLEETRLVRILEEREDVRARYDELMATTVEGVPSVGDDDELPPIYAVDMLLAPLRRAVPQTLSMAAATAEEPFYDSPTDESLSYVFEDRSRLYVQSWDDDMFVVFLERAKARKDDRFLGPNVERTWTSGALMGARVRSGEVRLRYAGESRRLILRKRRDRS